MAWFHVYAGFPAAQVATRLAPIEKWTNDGFLTVRALPAGTPNPELTERRSSVLQVDAWAAKANSARALWGVAAVMLEKVRIGTFRDNQPHGRPIEMPISGYLPARVLGSYLITEPTRVEGDPSGFAHMTLDLAVDWTV
jgi:hypothetical protein